MRCAPILILLYASAALAENFRMWGPEMATYLACKGYISTLGTFCTAAEGCWCSNEYAIQTMVACLTQAGQANATVERVMRQNCQQVDFDAAFVDKAYAEYALEAREGHLAQVVDYPLLLNDSMISVYVQSYGELYGNKDRSAVYGLVLIGYWAVVFALASVLNVFLALFPRARLHLNGTLASLIRHFCTLPALGKSHSAAKRWGVLAYFAPSRWQTAVTAGFGALAFVLCCVDFHAVKNDPLHTSQHFALTHYVANRCGIVSTFLVPLVVLMAGRNNFLQWTTGWHYGTFMVYHRWIARTTVLIALVHSVLATLVLVWKRVPLQLATSWYIVWGVLATAACLLIVVQSYLLLRRKWYRVFYLFHVVFGLVFLFGTLFHLTSLGYSFLMYIALGVWGLDRLVRLGRTLVFGFPKAVITLCANETLRVEIPRPKYWQPTAGGHVWLSFGLNIWQLNPFTLCPSVDDDNTIVLLCGVRNGATLAIAKRIAAAPGQFVVQRVSVEGPYGGPAPVKTHDNVVYIAGGNGVPGMFSEAYHLARKAPDADQSIKLVWAVREPKLMAWFHKELAAMRNTKIQATVYVSKLPEDGKMGEKMDDGLSFLTATSSASSDETCYEKSTRMVLADAFPHVTFVRGRPNVAEIVASETRLCKRSVAFVSCGHPAMVDDLRAAVVEKIARTTKRVDFFDQLQGWA